MATKRKEPESKWISWFLYSFELPLLCMSAKRYSEHLWRQLGMGCTMDGFRKDVKAAIKETVIFLKRK